MSWQDLFERAPEGISTEDVEAALERRRNE